MGVNGASKPRGRPLTKPRDATMRYIARKNLWVAVAAQCGITPSAVRLWSRVPHERVLSVERAIGRPRRLIRPDLYAENPKLTPTCESA
jgi:hypothetical protein